MTLRSLVCLAVCLVATSLPDSAEIEFFSTHSANGIPAAECRDEATIIRPILSTYKAPPTWTWIIACDEDARHRVEMRTGWANRPGTVPGATLVVSRSLGLDCLLPEHLGRCSRKILASRARPSEQLWVLVSGIMSSSVGIVPPRKRQNPTSPCLEANHSANCSPISGGGNSSGTQSSFIVSLPRISARTPASSLCSPLAAPYELRRA